MREAGGRRSVHCRTLAILKFSMAGIGCLLFGCGGTSAARPAAVGTSDRESSVVPSPEFSFQSLDDRPVTSVAVRGRVAVLAFVTIDNLMSQAQVRFLTTMAKHDGEQVAYALVLVESEDRRELAELYRQNLDVRFPVALADQETLQGGGPFAPLEGFPTVVVLDRKGAVAFRRMGVVKADELRGVMKRL